MRRVGHLEGGGLSGNGSGAGCAGAVESGERMAGAEGLPLGLPGI